MLYRLLAELVVVVHLLFIAFVAVGSVLALRWPRLVVLHVPVVLWAAAIVTMGFTCPLTPLEKALRERAGATSYDGGFVDHYLDGVIYPGRYTALARLLVTVVIVVGYTVLLAQRRHGRTPAPEGGPASAHTVVTVLPGSPGTLTGSNALDAIAPVTIRDDTAGRPHGGACAEKATQVVSIPSCAPTTPPATFSPSRPR